MKVDQRFIYDVMLKYNNKPSLENFKVVAKDFTHCGEIIKYLQENIYKDTTLEMISYKGIAYYEVADV